MKNKLMTLVLTVSFIATSAFAIKTETLDEGVTNIVTKNNVPNVLNFPFYIKNAKIISATANSFVANNEGKSVILIPTTVYKTERADLLITSKDGDTYIIGLTTENRENSERIFNFTSNKAQKSSFEQQTFETGKIDKDTVALFKRAANEENISGYKKLEIRKQFNTPDLLMQKDYILDGGKYRVEKWFIQNKSLLENVALEESNFYTNGILAISFDEPFIKPTQTTVMWLIINKASLVD